MTPSELREIRHQLDWSQTEAAERLGVSFRSYKYTEQGVNAHGRPQPAVPKAMAVAMLAYELAAEIQMRPIGAARLETFAGDVSREQQANLREPPSNRSNSQ